MGREKEGGEGHLLQSWAKVLSWKASCWASSGMRARTPRSLFASERSPRIAASRSGSVAMLLLTAPAAFTGEQVQAQQVPEAVLRSSLVQGPGLKVYSCSRYCDR